MTGFVERALKVQRDELGRGLLLFSYLFLVMTAYVVGKNAHDGLFLAKFGALKLPYVDIAIALLVGFVVALYVRIGRLISLRVLLSGSQLFFPRTPCCCGLPIATEPWPAPRSTSGWASWGCWRRRRSGRWPTTF
jgi:hypothetical protein